ncbi:MAG: DUF445 family protein [Gammaproteobacteria bacterium]|nr:DUF445 family protein [Gammaproteobacteria bacterium]
MNKSVLTNAIALVSCLVGWQLQIDWLFVMSLFALSGALTNWLAVHMLFEKVPGLYGSGIIQIKFEQFKSGIKTMIMQQFFTQENLEKFMSEQNGTAHHFDLEPIIADTDLSPAFDSLVSTIKQSSFGSMLNMFGGDEALEPLKQPFTDNLKASVIEISQTDEFAEKLKANVSSEQTISTMLDKVEGIVEQRLNELTPQMVKEIIQEMIKSHLGWLVVWGGFFGGIIGLIAHLLGV